MAISGDYPRPINVNGFACNNCDDVAKAKKFEDPAAPKGIEINQANTHAVSFGGALAGRNQARPTPDTQVLRQALDRYG